MTTNKKANTEVVNVSIVSFVNSKTSIRIPPILDHDEDVDVDDHDDKIIYIYISASYSASASFDRDHFKYIYN
jgi:hypothetical protein